MLLVFPLLKKEQDYPFEKTAKKIEMAVQYRLSRNMKSDQSELPYLIKLLSTPSYIMKELERLAYRVDPI